MPTLTSAVTEGSSLTGTRRIERLRVRLSATIGLIGQGRQAFVQRFVQHRMRIRNRMTADVNLVVDEAQAAIAEKQVIPIGTATIFSEGYIDGYSAGKFSVHVDGGVVTGPQIALEDKEGYSTEIGKTDLVVPATGKKEQTPAASLVSVSALFPRGHVTIGFMPLTEPDAEHFV